MKFFRQKNRGFTLLETLVAISIFTVSLLGIMSVLASSIANTSYAKQKMVATYLAQEGIEFVRNKRDTSVLNGATGEEGWNDFKSDVIDGVQYPVDPDFPGFTRNMDAEEIGADKIKITSDVYWTQGSGTYHIIFKENLFNWVE